MSAEQRLALVTGGAGGIGRVIVDELEAKRHQPVVFDLVESPRGDRPGEGTAEGVVDLSVEADVRNAARRLLDRFGHCDVLVHAAAAMQRASLETLDAATWRNVQAVNVESLLWLCQELVPSMRERRWGRVIIIVSDTVFEPVRDDMLPYVASKAALIGVARSLALSLGVSGITVNCVAPGLTPTARSLGHLDTAHFERVRSRQAIPRRLEPGDVSSTVAFLASDGASAITGQTICTDGGLVFH